MLQISNAEHISIVKNKFSYKKHQFEKSTAEAFRTLEKSIVSESFQPNEESPGLLERMLTTKLSPDEFKSKAKNLAEDFLIKTQKNRKLIIEEYLKKTEYTNLNPKVKAEIDTLTNSLISRGSAAIFPEIIAQMGKNLMIELAGNAISINDAMADTWICNNYIDGIVSIYGPNSDNDLSIPFENEIIKNLEQYIKGNNGYINKTEAVRELHFSGNHLTRFVLSEEIVKKIKALKTDDKVKGFFESVLQSDDSFLRSFIFNNTIEEYENHFLAFSLQINSNSFGNKDITIKDGINNNVGIAFGNAVIFNGNFAFKPAEVNYVDFYTFCPSFAGVANLNLNCPPHHCIG